MAEGFRGMETGTVTPERSRPLRDMEWCALEVVGGAQRHGKRAWGRSGFAAHASLLVELRLPDGAKVSAAGGGGGLPDTGTFGTVGISVG